MAGCMLQIVTSALNNLKGDLAGKYYPLSKMTDQEQEQLINVSLCLTSVIVVLGGRGVVAYYLLVNIYYVHIHTGSLFV